MATTPTTLVITIENKKTFPIEMAMVVMKQLFKYGVKEIVKKSDDCIIIYLEYSPKMVTLVKIIGTLPIKWTRALVSSEQELTLVHRAARKFQFALLDEDGSSTSTGATPAKQISSDEGFQESQAF